MKYEIFVATLTPFDQTTGNVDLAPIGPYCRLMLQDGADGFFVNGTSGEGVSLTTEERIRIAESWVEHAGNSKVIVHVGGTSLELTKALAKHAESLGVVGISAIPPFYYKPSNLDALVAYCKEVADSAPNTPFYFYHIPGMAGVTITVRDFFTKVRPSIPTLAGGKFSSMDMLDLERCTSHPDGPFKMFLGSDECFLPSLTIGVRAAIGLGYNLYVERFRQLLSDVERGDYQSAANHQHDLNSFYVQLANYPPIPATKALLKRRGVDLGSCRLPLREMEEYQADQLSSSIVL